mmetsp:Transcript_101099/g.286545  ORF Transcript_101099/g.286545 Transcript_101099/m.286545 type:complete len:257 (-) Transcript_101099:126-896(-)
MAAVDQKNASFARSGMLSRTGSSAMLKRTNSSSALRKTGDLALRSGTVSPTEGPDEDYLGVTSLTRRRKLRMSTGNLHGYMAEDYGRVNWPLPKMFGQEKYAYSLIDIEDSRFRGECAEMSRKLIRLSYDQQIVDLHWRKTYKALLDAEQRQATLPENCKETTKTTLKKEVDGHMKYLMELQEQKDMYEDNIKEVYSRCDAIKAELKKETDLEDLRMSMEKRQRDQIHGESPFWRTKFNIKSSDSKKTISGLGIEF